jgi:hypothetical protein
VENREFFMKMEQGVTYGRKEFKRSFKGTTYDIVTVIGPYSEKEKVITADRKCKGDYGPLLIEFEAPT